MAPAITRKSNRSTGVSRPARKTRTTRQGAANGRSLRSRHDEEEEEDSDEQENTSGENDNLDNFNFSYNGNGHDRALTIPDSTTDVQSALNPLREMANRVGREVETFAEKLDQFMTSLPTRNKFEAVLELVQEFKELAEQAARTLQKSNERDVALQLRREWAEKEKLEAHSSALTNSKAADPLYFAPEKKSHQVKEMRKWQQEADMWELFRIVLELHHNPDRRAVQREKEEALHRLGHVHRYTSEEDLFSRFVLEDDLAKERMLVKKWLEKTVDHQETDLAGITQELEARTSRGKGMWKNGWMHTREKIKAEKRTRTWSNAPGVPLPHVTRKDRTQLLATTLDPDAVSRQNRSLEQEDEYFERAMWIACWEMLRRGKSWDEVGDWCQKQREGWRAMSIGMATDPADVLSKATWRHTCYLASQADGSDEYEAAVYGLLGGGSGAVQKVCRNVDDKLYGHYNAALIKQFDNYLQRHYPDRALQTRRAIGEDAVKDPQQQIFELIEKLRKHPGTSSESIQPMKIIQSYLLANDLGSMIHTLGYAISFIDALQGGVEGVIMRLQPFWPGNDNQPEAEIALDTQALRVATHMSIILAALRTEELDSDEQNAEDNVTCAYIQALRSGYNRGIIPLYVSRLRRGRRVMMMSRALTDIKSPSEQQEILQLLKVYDMDVIAILNEQLYFLLSADVGPQLDNLAPLRMLEDTNETLYPGQRIVLNFLSQSGNPKDDAIIASLQWFNMLEGHWEDTFRSMGLALRKCLMAGRIACALRIANEFPYDALSKRKSYSVLGTSVNMMTFDGDIPEREFAVWANLKEQSRAYYELLQIVDAIKALANFRDLEAPYTGKAMKLSAAPPTLKAAKEHVDETMEYMLHENVLQVPDDADEFKDFAYIRNNFLPELIIAYNTVLHSAGSAISRDNLIQSMDLSVTVANNDKINECFAKAGRMRELVKSFAETSKKMLILKAAGKPWKPRKDRVGRELGIWEIGPQHPTHIDNHEVSL